MTGPSEPSDARARTDGARPDLRAQLAAHEPAGVHEATCVATLVAHLDALDRPYDEHAQLVHVTGSAMVAGPRGIVLHRHKRLGIWLQPGGHLDPGEEPWDGALREAVEETGLPGVRHPDDGPLLVNVDVHAGPRGHVHLDCRYLVLADDAEPAPDGSESQDVRWFPWEEAEALVALDRQLVSAIRRARAGHARTAAAQAG